MPDDSKPIDTSAELVSSSAKMTRRQAIQGIMATTAAGVASEPIAAPAANTIRDRGAHSRTCNTAIKQSAFSDYRNSLAAFGGQLASPPQKLLDPTPKGTPWDYEVAIIGSGYGGSICAARLAARLKPGQRLCLIERGREWVPGTFPDNFLDISNQAQRPLYLEKRNHRIEDNPLGLINLLRGDDVTVMSGSGLGGTSLINANVALRPDRDVFQQAGWPNPLRDRDFLEPYLSRAEWELGVAVEPWDMSCKMRAQRIAAQNLADCGAHYEAAALSVTRGPQIGMPIINRQGMVQRPCTSCGDCMTGCNVGAKNTLAMNYLPLAKRFGAELFTQTKVNSIQKFDGYYGIHFTHYLTCDDGIQEVHGCLKARIAIISAGSLGSTQLLLKSQAPNMQYSNCLGQKWTGNGDILGIIEKTNVETNIAGFGAQESFGRIVGPTIQSNITYPHNPLPSRFLIQDGGVAGAYSKILTMLTRDFQLDRTMVLLVMGHDASHGRIELDQYGNPRVIWPNYNNSEYRTRARQELHRTASALGGEFKDKLVWSGQAATVHPLGGCALADDPYHGVSNHKGQVFDFAYGGSIDEQTGDARVHQGLYVCDGAIMPTSIGVNPYITIAALAERTAQLISLEPNYADIFAG
jgi:cholesterol oxidase